MKMSAIVVVLGMILIQGAPVAQARECEQRTNELGRHVRDLQEQIVQLNDEAQAGQTRHTTTGVEFTRVPRVHRDFGESWRDPSGMIWGDIAKNDDGSIRRLNHNAAMAYCLSMNPDPSERARIRAALEAGQDPERGIFLPRRQDFVRLREYMGAVPKYAKGYTPQVLPNLTANWNGSTYGHSFWSSSVVAIESYLAHTFDGQGGVTFLHSRDSNYPFETVRCVARR